MMDTEWVNINKSYNPKNVPRLLTKKEIQKIASSVPLAPSADKTAAEVCQKNIQEWITDMLTGEKIDPEGIDELIDMIRDQHFMSLVAPGTALIVAPEAVGSTTTQMTLNTFHSSGSSKSATIGIDSMKDIIFARTALKNEFCTIRFKENKTYEEVLNSRKNICGTYVSNFVKSYEIFDSATVEKFWWHNTFNLLSDDDVSPEETNSEKMLRIYLDVNEMYKYKVTIQDIVSKIENAPADVFVSKDETKRKKKSKDDIKLFVSSFSPNSIGIIDIYPREDMVIDFLNSFNDGSHGESMAEKIPRKILEEIYLENFVIPDFNNIKIKGISGISNLVPMVQPIWSVITAETKLEGKKIEEATLWSVKYSSSLMSQYGISIDNIKHLLSEACIKFISVDKITQRIEISMPRDRFRTSENEVVIISMDGTKYYTLFSPVELTGKPKTFFYKQVDMQRWIRTNEGWNENYGKHVRKYKTDDIVFTKQGSFVKIPKTNVSIENGLYYEDVTNKLDYRELKPSEYIFYKVRDRKQEYTKKNIELQNKYKLESEKLPKEKRANWILRQEKLPKDPLVLASELVYAEVKGSNLRELFTLPEIDSNRTTCNNMHVLSDTLGIEAARTFVIKSLYDNITNYGSYVSPANILFIAEFITSRGVPLGATYTGIARQKGGHLSLATVERAGVVFTKSAIYGKKENIKNVSASIVVGTRVAIGDGAFDIAQDITKNGETKTIINKDLLETFHDSLEKEDDEDVIHELLKGEYKTDQQEYDITEGEGVSALTLYDEKDICELNNPISDMMNGPIKEGTEEATDNIVYGIATSSVKESKEEEDKGTVVLKPLSEGVLFPISCDEEDITFKNTTGIIEKPIRKETIVSPLKKSPKPIPPVSVSPLASVSFNLPDISDMDLEETQKRQTQTNEEPKMIDINALEKALK